MVGIPSLSEAVIRRQATPESFSRGQSYYGDGAVLSLVQRGNVVQAEVVGSQYEPYHVRVTFDEGGITDERCSCPYDWGGICKHIVAALLACLYEPELIEERLPLDQLLVDLDLEQLREVILRLATSDPSAADGIERLILAIRDVPDEDAMGGARQIPPKRLSLVDPQAVRHQVTGILGSLDHMRRSEAYWHVSSVVAQVRSLLEQAQVHFEVGDGRKALLLLEAITDGYVAGWTRLDDSDGYASAFFGELGAAWIGAALSVADLTAEERVRWAQALTHWQARLGDYGLDEVFDAAQVTFALG